MPIQIVSALGGSGTGSGTNDWARLLQRGAAEVRNMSATQSRTALIRISCGAQHTPEAAEASRQAASNASPQRFVTSGTPHSAPTAQESEVDTGVWQRATLRENYWPVWSAADSGDPHSDPGAPDADGGEGSGDESVLSGLMLERFDDDERWRELARTGRAL
jgi:hypothetical protein